MSDWDGNKLINGGGISILLHTHNANCVNHRFEYLLDADFATHRQPVGAYNFEIWEQEWNNRSSALRYQTMKPNCFYWNSIAICDVSFFSFWCLGDTSATAQCTHTRLVHTGSKRIRLSACRYICFGINVGIQLVECVSMITGSRNSMVARRHRRPQASSEILHQPIYDRWAEAISTRLWQTITIFQLQQSRRNDFRAQCVRY